VRKPEVVCILGSTKFKDRILGVAQRETLKGNIVLIHGFFHHVDLAPITDDQKQMLDELMLRKVEMADRCFVVNFNGYIGQSTKGAIAHARNNMKPVEYLDKDHVEVKR
jgi:hypothetical protein